jgi:hypothetical protein
MNPQWQAFLTAQHAHIDSGSVLDFGDLTQELRTLETHPWFADLSHLSTLCVRGAKAGEFLQGQLTCDIDTLTEGEISLGACCDHKGRMLANFRIWTQQANYYLLLPNRMRDTVMTHLRKYAVFSKVEINPMDETLIAIEYCGEHPPSVGTVLPLAKTNSHYLILIHPKNMESIWNTLTTHSTPIGAIAWRAFNIQRGLHFLIPETSGLFTPQMINLQLLGGVSFKKGCYVGQEIVARTEHLGKLKRHQYHGTLNGSTSPQPSDELMNTDSQSIGVITDVAPSLHADFQLLAVIQDRAVSSMADIYYNEIVLKNLQRR